MEQDEDQRTVWCGNLSDKVTEEVLYELFLQAGPVRRVKIPKDKDGNQLSYGFVTFKHVESVPYAISLIEGISLYDRRLNLKPRQRQDQSGERSPAANQIVHNHFFIARDLHGFSPNNRGHNHSNYGYNDNYGGNGGNNRHHLKHDRRGSNSYHSSGGRYGSPNNKPYNHHKNERNRRNRH